MGVANKQTNKPFKPASAFVGGLRVRPKDWGGKVSWSKEHLNGWRIRRMRKMPEGGSWEKGPRRVLLLAEQAACREPQREGSWALDNSQGARS